MQITDHIGVDRVNILDDKGGASISNQNNKGSHESINTQMLRGKNNVSKSLLAYLCGFDIIESKCNALYSLC